MVLSEDMSVHDKRALDRELQWLLQTGILQTTLTNLMKYSISLVTADNYPTFIHWSKSNFPHLYQRLPFAVKDFTPYTKRLRNLHYIIPEEVVDMILPAMRTLFSDTIPCEENRRMHDLISASIRQDNA
jgi:hypothetical protein